MPYVPYYAPNRAAQSIADLLLRRGDIEANRSTAIGNASANAALQSGNAWAGAISGIGQAVASIPGQMQAAKDADLRRRDVQAQLAERDALAQQRARAGQDAEAIDRAFSPAAALGPGGVGPMPQNAPAPSRDQILNAVPGHLRDEVQKTFAQADKLAVDSREARLKADATTREYMGFLGAQIKQAGYDPSIANLALQHAEESHADDPDTLKQIGQMRQAFAQDPTSIQRVADAAILGSSYKDELKPNTVNVNPGDTVFDKNTGKPIYTAPPKPEKPGSIEEQLLEAISKGDTQKADQIKETLRTKAEASKDPAQVKLANELANLRVDEAKARLEGLKTKNTPLDIEPDIQTTVSGRKYIDISGYTAAERGKAREAANAAGAIPISKEQANALQEIDNARLNQRAIVDQIGDLLPKGFAGRAGAAVTVPLEKLFQTNDQVAAFNSWRTAAIQTLRATAGSKGLRINQAEIGQAIENDIPKLTDTVGVAQQKVKNIETMLENAEKSILVRDRSAQDASQPIKVGAFTVRVK